MSNPTPKAKQQMFRLSTSAKFPALLEITHPSLDGGVLRLINSDQSVEYNGKLFNAANFSYTAPKYSDKQMGDGSITISAIDQSIIVAIRKMNGRAKAVVVAAFYFDEGILLFESMEEWKFSLTQVSWDNLSATWQMQYDDRMRIMAPCDKMTPQKCPGVA